MLGFMDGQGDLAQNKSTPTIQTVCYLSNSFDNSVPDRIESK